MSRTTLDEKQSSLPTTERQSATAVMHWLARFYGRWRYAILFYSLLTTIAVGPVVDALGLSPRLLKWPLTINLVAAVVPVGAGAGRRLLLVALFLALIASMGAEWFGQMRLSAIALSFWTAIALIAAASSLRFALRATEVDQEHLYAALDVYLLAGMFLGVFYFVVESTWPGSLVTVNEATWAAFSLSNAIYFSFVTLATLGYGDIVPRSELARGTAIVEAIAGQLYLAVMIARLVSLYVHSDPANSGKTGRRFTE